MLKAFSAFLLLFWILSLVVHVNSLAYMFAVGALAAFGIDVLLSHLARNSRPSTTRLRETVL